MHHLSTVQRFGLLSFWLLSCFFSVVSCQDHRLPETPVGAPYPADVLTSWLTLQLKLTRTTPAPPPVVARRFAYSGIAGYEAIVAGLPGYQTIAPQLNGLPALPTPTPAVSYYWPASANAALAAMSRYFYPTTSAANKAAIDSLEAATSQLYQTHHDPEELNRSAAFGKQIANAVFDWAKTDGNDNTTPYIPVVGQGLWIPTPPAFLPAALPNWGKNRPILLGSDAGADQGPPVPYSEDPQSAYYAQAQEVLIISQHLTDEQKTIAQFWADNTDGNGFAGGHWMYLLNQEQLRQGWPVDKVAVGWVQLGVAISEAQISLFKSKYLYNRVRPITYIRTVLNQPDWNAFIPTVNHPEYPAGHAVAAGAATQTLTLLFGTHYPFTDTSYRLGGYSPRFFNSFQEAALEAGNSRIYGGLHYRKTIDGSQLQGQVIANNVARQLKFKP